MNTIRHGEDGTLSRNAIQHWLFLIRIREYQLIKAKKHPR